ncbi:MAG: hypothetical protein AAB871_03775 [Patescibacteria group bacterium]
MFVVGIGGLAYLVSSFDPKTLPWLNLGVLYLTIFFAGVGLSGLLGIVLRIFLGGRISVPQNGLAIFRQALFLGFALTIAVFFQSARILNLYTATLLVLALGILEMYFLNR